MKIRIKYEKFGTMKFIGHLDIMRYFQKIFRRADVDICYSTGFNPHMILSFALPLGVGETSSGDYADIEVNSTSTSAEMISRMNAVLCPEIRVTKYLLLPDTAKTGMAVVCAADYEAVLRAEMTEELAEKLKKSAEAILFKQQIPVEKKTKSGIKTIDIRPMIYSLSFDGVKLGFRVAAGSAANLRPDLLLSALAEDAGIKDAEFDIHRCELFAENFTPLYAYGTEIE